MVFREFFCVYKLRSSKFINTVLLFVVYSVLELTYPYTISWAIFDEELIQILTDYSPGI